MAAVVQIVEVLSERSQTSSYIAAQLGSSTEEILDILMAHPKIFKSHTVWTVIPGAKLPKNFKSHTVWTVIPGAELPKNEKRLVQHFFDKWEQNSQSPSSLESDSDEVR